MGHEGERAVFALSDSLDGPLLGTVGARRGVRVPGQTTGERAGHVEWCGEVGIVEVWARVEPTTPARCGLQPFAGFEPFSEADGWVDLRAATT